MQGQTADGAVQRVPAGQTAPGTVVLVVAPSLTALHLQATAGAFTTIAQVQALVVPAVHTPTSVALRLKQELTQPAGGLRTQASSLPGVVGLVVTIANKEAHPAPVGATASEVQTQVRGAG